MRKYSHVACVVALVALVALVADRAISLGAQTPAGGGDVYHVHFAKAVPGEAAALGKQLSTPDTTQPMPDHFVVLRHQEGDDWDYVAIQHVGERATVAVTGPPPPARPLNAWHSDTFVSGPPWAEFTKAMGIGGGAAANMVYTVGVHRPVPGHREQLMKALTGPGPQSKVQTGDVLFTHLEGGDWTFMTITRHNSWQDFATDRAAAASAGDTTAGGWADIRQHSAFHRDTIADRVAPR